MQHAHHRDKTVQMKSKSIVPKTFFAAFLLMILGAYQKIRHTGIADILLAIGLVATAIFIVAAVYEVWSSAKIQHRKKILWTIALILGGTIAGLIYVVIGRKRIAARS
jgi:hypothetical protein